MTLSTLCLFLGFLLGGCASTPVQSSAPAQRPDLENECFKKVVNNRTWGPEVPPEDLLAYIGGNWKVRQVRVFQKITREKSPPAYFAYVIEPTIPGKDMDLSNIKGTLLCESNPEYGTF
jgi:hypothetical protein